MKTTNQEQKIETAIGELIDNVERFFSVAPLRFLCSDCNETINSADDESTDSDLCQARGACGNEMPFGDVYFRRNDGRCPAESWRLAISP